MRHKRRTADERREGRWFYWLVIVLAIVVAVDTFGSGSEGGPRRSPGASVLGEVITRDAVTPTTDDTTVATVATTAGATVTTTTATTTTTLPVPTTRTRVTRPTTTTEPPTTTTTPEETSSTTSGFLDPPTT